jgi:CheY-like chemotaxis protein
VRPAFTPGCSGLAGIHSGTEVLPAIRAFKPDIVLLDIKMPGLSGYQVARLIRERYASSVRSSSP